MEGTDILVKWLDYCNKKNHKCDECKFAPKEYCCYEFAYNLGMKTAFDAVVNLLGAYQKEDKHDRS